MKRVPLSAFTQPQEQGGHLLQGRFMFCIQGDNGESACLSASAACPGTLIRSNNMPLQDILEQSSLGPDINIIRNRQKSRFREIRSCLLFLSSVLERAIEYTDGYLCLENT